MKRILIAGRRPDVSNYIYALTKAKILPIVDINLPLQKEYSIAPFDALLLPGGGDIDPALFGEENHGSRAIDKELDEAQLQILDEFVKANKPVLGICKGCQIINIYFHGNIIQDLQNSFHHQTYMGKEVRHKAISQKNNIFADMFGEGEIIVNSSHHQAIGQLGEGIKTCQYSDDGVIEAICHEKLPIWATQWHPERMAYDKHICGEADGTVIFEYLKTMI